MKGTVSDLVQWKFAMNNAFTIFLSRTGTVGLYKI